jgi:hypothetical protein
MTGLESDHVDGGGGSGGSINITMIESMYHLLLLTVRRPRLAYSPRAPQESHLNALGLEILAHRHLSKADAMMRGIKVAGKSEARMCEKLCKIGEAMWSVKRLRGLGKTDDDYEVELTSCIGYALRDNTPLS